MSEVQTPIEPFLPRLPHVFGAYELLAEIGRGGMGVIYQARQSGLGRLCAIKMLHHAGMFAGPAGEEMLRQEAAAAARLDHANIVGIYEAGREQGQLYFSMEYVEGVNLTGFTRDKIVGAEEVARLTRTIAEAIAYAHSRGVWHHDLKPANVLIDERGWPQITDFGLARRVGENQRGDPGAGAGSPNYLAPEQASARYGEPGARTDVFGLGAILYFLLTDRPPFRGETVTDTLRAVLESDPVRPRVLRSGVPLDLETICLKCLEKSPAQRYVSPQEVADDLGRFLNHEPILARPAGPVLRAQKWCRRHPGIALLSAVIVMLLVALAGGSMLAAVRIRRERDFSQAAQQRAETSEQEARRELYANDLQRAYEAYEANDLTRADELLRRQSPTTPPTSGRPDLRGWEWNYLRGITRSDESRRLHLPTRLSDFVRIEEPPGLLVARTDGQLQTVSLPELQPTALQRVRPGTNILQLLSLSADRQQLAVAAFDSSVSNTLIRVSTPDGRQEFARFTVPGGVSAMEIAPREARRLWLVEMQVDNRQVLQRFVERTLPDGALVREIPLTASHRLPSATLSPDGRWLAVGQDDAAIELWDLQSGGKPRRLVGHQFEPGWMLVIYGMRFSRDGQLLVTTGADKTARLWSVPEGRLRHVFSGHTDVVVNAEFLEQSQQVMTSSRDGTIRYWSQSDGSEQNRLRGAGARVGGLLAAANEKEIYSLDDNGLVRSWGREPSHAAVETKPLPGGYVWAELLPDTHSWWTCSDTLEWRLGTADAPEHPQLFPEQNAANIRARTYCAAIDTRANYQRNGVLVLTPGAGGPTRELTGGVPTMVASARFSLSGRWIAVGTGSELFHRPNETNQVAIWQVADGTLLHRFEGPSEILCFSPDEQLLATADSAGHLNLIDLRTSKARALAGHAGQIPGLAFSSDAKLLASGSSQGGARIWEVKTGEMIADLPVPGTGVLSVTFTPDGSRLLTGSLDGTIHLWDLQSLHPVGTLRGHHRGVTSLAFRDQKTLISLGLDEIRTWQLLPPDPAPSESTPGPALK